mmetsp:Transcript_98211/g.273326  ORF Transcript_98211/g.273326 Transcript_98211/m.273326 type:complete len:230 (-) Transcript_98211:78-767(-)
MRAGLEGKTLPIPPRVSPTRAGHIHALQAARAPEGTSPTRHSAAPSALPRSTVAVPAAWRHLADQAYGGGATLATPFEGPAWLLAATTVGRPGDQEPRTTVGDGTQVVQEDWRGGETPVKEEPAAAPCLFGEPPLDGWSMRCGTTRQGLPDGVGELPATSPNEWERTGRSAQARIPRPPPARGGPPPGLIGTEVPEAWPLLTTTTCGRGDCAVPGAGACVVCDMLRVNT